MRQRFSNAIAQSKRTISNSESLCRGQFAISYMFTMAVSSSGKHKVQEPEDLDMAPAAKKARRCKKTKTTSSTKSMSTASSSGSTHPYLRDREISAIEHWNDGIPAKNIREETRPNDVDPVIQAYMQAKMALFHNLSVKSKKSDSSISTSRMSSRTNAT